jgi:hypothetical protein
VKLEEQGNKVVIRLLSGSLQYQFAAGSNLVLFAGKNTKSPVPPALQGIVSLDTNSKTLRIVAASGAGAAAIITTVALVKRSPSTP